MTRAELIVKLNDEIDRYTYPISWTSNDGTDAGLIRSISRQESLILKSLVELLEPAG